MHQTASTTQAAHKSAVYSCRERDQHRTRGRPQAPTEVPRMSRQRKVSLTRRHPGAHPALTATRCPKHTPSRITPAMQLQGDRAASSHILLELWWLHSPLPYSRCNANGMRQILHIPRRTGQTVTHMKQEPPVTQPIKQDGDHACHWVTHKPTYASLICMQGVVLERSAALGSVSRLFLVLRRGYAIYK